MNTVGCPATERLTGKEAFDAMVLFLEKFYVSTESDDVAVLLGSMMVLGDGGTADPAVRGLGRVRQRGSEKQARLLRTNS